MPKSCMYGMLTFQTLNFTFFLPFSPFRHLPFALHTLYHNNIPFSSFVGVERKREQMREELKRKITFTIITTLFV